MWASQAQKCRRVTLRSNRQTAAECAPHGWGCFAKGPSSFTDRCMAMTRDIQSERLSLGVVDVSQFGFDVQPLS